MRSETSISKLVAASYVQDPDVLDTWFSSALWPHSTLGWPEQTPELAKYYPTSVLSTARDIITLWVARMVIFGQFNMGEIPFKDVYIHPVIQDGNGQADVEVGGQRHRPGRYHRPFRCRYALADSPSPRSPPRPRTSASRSRRPSSPTAARSTPPSGSNRPGRFPNKVWNFARLVLDEPGRLRGGAPISWPPT